MTEPDHAKYLPPLPPQWVGNQKRPPRLGEKGWTPDMVVGRDDQPQPAPEPQPGHREGDGAWTPAYPPPPPGWGQQPPMRAVPGGYAPQPGWQPPKPAEKPHHTMALVALILGICSLVFGSIINILGFPALGAGIVAFILACVAYSDQKMAKWALWISILGIAASIYGIYEVVHALQQVTGS